MCKYYFKIEALFYPTCDYKIAWNKTTIEKDNGFIIERWKK
jgi:hypothetical protein